MAVITSNVTVGDNETKTLVSGDTYTKLSSSGSSIKLGTNSTLIGDGIVFTGNLNTSYNCDGAAILGTQSINSISLSNSTISANKSYRYGGAIYFSSGEATFTNDLFVGNSITSYDGGAIYTENGNVTLIGGTYSGNKAAQKGGLLYCGGTATLSGGTYTGNSGKYGGVAYNNGGIFVSQDVLFDGNTATGGSSTSRDGGGVLCIQGGSVTSTNDIFINNMSTVSAGGAVLINGSTSSTVFTVNSSTFSKNSSKWWGGAVSMGGNSNGVTLILNAATFTENKSTSGAGGAIDVQSGGIIFSTNSIFEGNKATGSYSDGGAIQLIGTATILGDRFENNYAVYGGAVYVSSGGGMYPTFFFSTTASYLGNTAKDDGGAVDNYGTASFTQDVFRDNETGDRGGAVANFGTFTANTVTFENNLSKGNRVYQINDYGGGAVFNFGTFISTESVYESNTSSSVGGVIQNYGETGYDEGYSGFVSSTKDLFTDNLAVDGGVVSNWGTFTSNTSTYTQNSASNAGGAIYNFGGVPEKTVRFPGDVCCGIAMSTKELFTENTATDGGAVYNSGVAVFTNDLFEQNTATADGGAVCNDNSVYVEDEGDEADAFFSIGTFTANASTFTKNSAASGGAIFNSAMAYSVDNLITENTATQNGGAVCNGLKACTWTELDNDTTHVFNLGGTYTSNDTIYSKNTAVNGGAIFNGSSCTAFFTGDLFTQNVATDGGAIFNDAEGLVHISGSTFAMASESIRNLGDVYFSGTNLLNSVLDGSGLSHSEAANTVIKGAGTVGQTYAADGFETTFGAATSGMNIDATVIGGYVDKLGKNAKLHFINAAMTTASKVYGAGVAAANGSYTADSVAIDFAGTGMGAKALLCAGGKGAAGASIEVGTITVTSSASGDMGILYGGADLSDGGSFKAGTVTTTISGNGNYLSFVGNGCKNGNTGATGVITTNIGTSSVSISGGTFNNLVYGGAYAAGDSVTCGTANMTISGGTFNFSVYGGNGGKSTATTAGGKSVVGSVNVTIDVTGSNTVVFNRHLSSGSFGDGKVSGDTHMTFTGNGTNLSFGADSYVTGHSQNAYHFGANKIQTFVGGESHLTFNSYKGDFTGSLSNGFTNVSFSSDSSVVFKGAIESDLRFTSVWDFAVGGGSSALLDWGQANNGRNSFKGDTINLTLEDGFTGSKVLMNAGNDANLLTGWESATVTLGGGTMTYDSDNKWYSDGSYKLYVDTTSGNRLMLASI